MNVTHLLLDKQFKIKPKNALIDITGLHDGCNMEYLSNSKEMLKNTYIVDMQIDGATIFAAYSVTTKRRNSIILPIGVPDLNRKV